LVHLGAIVCKVRVGTNRERCMPKTTEMKRFTVSLEPRAYEALRKIAESQRPPLSLQYVVRYALEEFLEGHEGRQLTLKLKGEDQE